MTRRTATLVASIVVLVISIGLVTAFPVPFVSFSPGPVKDTLGESKGKPVIEISGHETFQTSGRLDLTTVSVTSPERELTLPQAMRNWLDPHHDLFPRDIIYPPDQTADEVEEQNTAEMTGSQDSAIAAALQAAKVPFNAKVSTVGKDIPADGKLKPGDIVLAVDGVPVSQVPQVGDLVRKHKVGEDVVFLIRRGSSEQTVQLKTAPTPGEPTRPMVGITDRHRLEGEGDGQPRPGHRRPECRHGVRAGHLRQADSGRSCWTVSTSPAPGRSTHSARSARSAGSSRRSPAPRRTAPPSSLSLDLTARLHCTRA